MTKLLAGLPGFVATAELLVDDASEPSLLPDEEALLSVRAVESRRRNFALGRTAARRALAELDVDPVPILRGRAGEPLWPPGVVGSITHASGHALAAVAFSHETGGIGIDLEHRDRFFPELAENVAFGEELRRLGALDVDHGIRATLEVFSAKESIYKAFYPRVGRFFGFAAARVEPRAGYGYEGRLVEALDTDYPFDRTFSIGCSWHGELVLTALVLAP